MLCPSSGALPQEMPTGKAPKAPVRDSSCPEPVPSHTSVTPLGSTLMWTGTQWHQVLLTGQGGSSLGTHLE